MTSLLKGYCGLLDRRFEGIEAAIHEKGRSSTTSSPALADYSRRAQIRPLSFSRSRLTRRRPGCAHGFGTAFCRHLLSLAQGKTSIRTNRRVRGP